MEPIAFDLASEEKPLIMVPVQIDGQGPFDFVLDTGASHCVLSKRLAQALEIEGAASKEGKCAADAASASVSLSLGTVATMQVGTVVQENVAVGLMEMDHLEETLGRPLDGILGYNFLSHYTLLIDYANRRFSLEDGSIGKTGSLELS